MKKPVFAIAIFFLIVSLSSIPTQAEERIGINCNFYPEIKPFLSRIDPDKISIKYFNGLEFYSAKIKGKEIVIFMGGADQAAASANLQKAIDEFKLTKIIVSGICGSISPDVHIGDVVIPERWANHTYAYLSPKNKNFAPFFKPEAGFSVPYGFMYHDRKELNLMVGYGDIVKEMMWFPVDGELMKVAGKIKSRVKLKKIDTEKPRLLIGGNGVSGSWFVDNYEYRLHLRKYFKAEVVDIESQALCQVAMMNRIPILVVRCVSDYAGNEKGEHNKALKNLFIAAGNSTEVVWKIIEEL
ncbi:MAG: 5'-methylthioadenosine/S-adenosylhomocysteine nucleosidase [Candidatus Eremiobacteraeota bacterium]|nr:5'-methylthioadenosine/S-adenosylhomocysteine nucleosidase [Candidatus Eremiobacteraeota bacterium]